MAPLGKRPDQISGRRDLTKVFLTVGVQLPFDRLVSALYELDQALEIRGQVGATGLNLPDNYKRFVSNDEYMENIHWCDVVISHAGMGSILTSLEYNKALIVAPRLAALNEHRNDHQLDTVKSLREINCGNSLVIALPTITAAKIMEAVNTLAASDGCSQKNTGGSSLDRLACFINEKIS